jgi:hypothetical protein
LTRAADKVSPAYPYNSGDSRTQKATLEHIFKPDHGDVDIAATADAASTSGRVQAPWDIGWQVNERNIMWNDDLKMRLVKVCTTYSCHMSDVCVMFSM